MECILNELSAQTTGTVGEAWDMMAHFVRAVAAVQRMGLRQIRIPEELGQNLYTLPIAPEYAVGAWLNDERVDRDLKDRFRLIVANPPLLTSAEIDALTLLEQSAFCLTEPAGTPEARGFGAAYLADRLLISLLTDIRWDTNQLRGWHWYLDAEGQEQTAEVEVRHFATTGHVEWHKPWIQQQQFEQLQRSSDVWKKRTELFPNIVLCGEVEGQLKKIGMSSYLTQIIDRLRTLDAFVVDWENGNFNLDQLNTQTNLRVSGESSPTMQRFSGQRKFKLPDGRRETFELHIKVGDMRFHFYPDNRERKVYVGYIGPHLATVSG